jgi:hypothetical protein
MRDGTRPTEEKQPGHAVATLAVDVEVLPDEPAPMSKPTALLAAQLQHIPAPCRLGERTRQSRRSRTTTERRRRLACIRRSSPRTRLCRLFQAPEHEPPHDGQGNREPRVGKFLAGNHKIRFKAEPDNEGSNHSPNDDECINNTQEAGRPSTPISARRHQVSPTSQQTRRNYGEDRSPNYVGTPGFPGTTPPLCECLLGVRLKLTSRTPSA